MKILRQRVTWLFAIVLVISFMAIDVRAAPNFVLIELENIPTSDITYLPRTSAFLRSNGVEFTNAFTAESLCSPSRAMILTGKYPHNNGVRSNKAPDGGYTAFYLNGNDPKTIATWLQARGYATAFFGKYLNEMGTSQTVVPMTHVPPGWGAWYGNVGRERYYNYTLNENGSLINYGSTPADYVTDVLAAKAGQVLAHFVTGSQPFFMMLSPYVPHRDAITGLPVPAPRHAQMAFDGLRAPRSASFNELDVSDKSADFRALPLLTEADIAALDGFHRARAQTLLAADEMIAGLIAQLNAAGVLNKTFVFLTADHGIFQGDHRNPDGYGPMFEPVNRIPLLVSGPGVVAGSKCESFVVNIDIFPTIADLSQAGTAPIEVDGRSFAALLKYPARSIPPYRKSFLRYQKTGGGGLRLPTYSYKELYRTDGTIRFRELYDLRQDPDETSNIAPRLTPESAQALNRYVSMFKACSGATCRALEDSVDDDAVRLLPVPQ